MDLVLVLQPAISLENAVRRILDIVALDVQAERVGELVPADLLQEPAQVAGNRVGVVEHQRELAVIARQLQEAIATVAEIDEGLSEQFALLLSNQHLLDDVQCAVRAARIKNRPPVNQMHVLVQHILELLASVLHHDAQVDQIVVLQGGPIQEKIKGIAELSISFVGNVYRQIRVLEREGMLVHRSHHTVCGRNHDRSKFSNQIDMTCDIVQIHNDI